MSDIVSLTLGRIENEISRHKAAHESHLHWAIILFAANIAVFIRNGFSAELWPLPAIGLVLNLSLWCRAARAYNALARHWESRDKVYEALLKGFDDAKLQFTIASITQLLDGDQSRRVWTKGALSTLLRVGLPEFILLEGAYILITYCVLQSAPATLWRMLWIVAPCVVFILVFGLMRLQVNISVLRDGDYQESKTSSSENLES